MKTGKSYKHRSGWEHPPRRELPNSSHTRMKRGFLLRAAPSSQAKPAAAMSNNNEGFDLSNLETPLAAADVERRKREGGESGQGLCADRAARRPPPTATGPTRNLPTDAGGRQPDWSALPDLPLGGIAQRLATLMDFFSFRGVCTSWRSVGGAIEGVVMASNPPLFFESSLNSFYHLAEKRVYKKRMPIKPLTGELRVSVAGFAHGHLILRRGRTTVWLSNPLTGAENRCFPRTKLPFRDAVLSSPPTSPGCVLVAHALDGIQYCRPGGKEWHVVCRPRGRGIRYNVFEVAIVGDKGYVLIDGLGLATFDFTENPELTILNVEHILRPGSELNHYNFFAESEGELFVFSTLEFSLAEFKVFRFDSLSCKWVRSENLGGRAVFVDGRRGSLFVDNYAEWGGSKDCIYFFEDDDDENQLVEYKVKDGRSKPFLFPTKNPVMCCFNGVWVLPSLS